MIARAREQGALTVVVGPAAQPTFTADLASGDPGAVDAGVTGTLHVTNSGAMPAGTEFTEAIMELAGVEVPIEQGITTIAPGGVGSSAERRAARPRLGACGLPALRPWREALADYMRPGRLLAGAAV